MDAIIRRNAQCLNRHGHGFEPDQFLRRLRLFQAYPLFSWVVGFGHDIVAYREVREQVQRHLVNGDLPESDAGCDPLDRMVVGLENEGVPLRTGTGRVRIESRFVATMVLALRCALGRLPLTAANKLVVEREYLRLCRARNMRLTVTESNRALTIDSYFEEECMDRIVTRGRLPKWLRWLEWIYSTPGRYDY